MKRYLYILMTAASLTACVKDLDTLPLNTNEPVSEYVYGNSEEAYLAGLARLYFQFVSNDLTDLQQMDGGASEVIRAFWSVQETTTDEAKCSWENDAWVRALNTNTWTEAQNDAVYAVYVRTLQGIAYVNEYLRQTTPEKLASRNVDSTLSDKIDGFRAEARFIRAYLYWMALDCFANVPFSTEDSPFGGTYVPPQASGKDIFNFCITELEFLASAESPLNEARSVYPRADKGAATGLLARMYLNAEVYAGTPMWSKAKDACERIFSMGYSLCPDYQALFRGDNGENPDARAEMLWTVTYDADRTESYGGTSYLLAATLASTDITDQSKPNGQRNGWAGLRVPYEFVSRFFKVSGQDYVTGDYQVNDKRGAMFYIKGREESMENALYSFMNGWSCLKFNNIPHDMTEKEFLPTAETTAFGNVDFPMIRLGEIYLIYAEACIRLGQTGTALPYMAELSRRAGIDPPSSSEIESRFWLMEERARELMWEGHRRTDLIRYGFFNTDEYLWPYKGGDSYTGQAFPAYKCLFSIPPTELATNTGLAQNPGYAVP
ncbi:MAG: RagB/SusD family nutrient uptake outer membrane protein [Bacteroidales bacterium]|nr:RagB/SusD family nutrient uptake outer membrane protein [Bacteroidales bacterium]MBQ6689347.1 RagB/SusD family nutrient uptake outer membrane protein [Bacteroidales bacterium]